MSRRPHPTRLAAALIPALVFSTACGADPDRGDVETESAVNVVSSWSVVDPFAGSPDGVWPFCSGHVSGVQNENGTMEPSILWEAHAIAETPDVLLSRYEEILGRPADIDEDGCGAWRDPADAPERTFEICPASADRRWSVCATLPPEARSVAHLSSMIGPDAEEDPAEEEG